MIESNRGLCRTSWSLDHRGNPRTPSKSQRYRGSNMNTGRNVIPECTFNSTFSSHSLTCLSAGNSVGYLDSIAHPIPNSPIVFPKGCMCKATHSLHDTIPKMISVEKTDYTIQVESTVICDPIKGRKGQIPEECRSFLNDNAQNKSIDNGESGSAQSKSNEGPDSGSCWIQLTGHTGNLKTNANGEVLKAYCQTEANCLRSLRTDSLRPFVPEFLREEKVDGIQYVVMQNLLYQFSCPYVMDCKIGQRTYLEDEVTCSDPRQDMYQKMIAVDPKAPTDEEHLQQAVTKLRYMQWRETLSSTSLLGFRIEAIKHHDKPTNQSFKKIAKRSVIKSHFLDFVQRDSSVANQYFKRLQKLKEHLETSDFFKSHELIGSSLLFAHDAGGTANVWMIDFGKSTPLPQGKSVDHHQAWSPGNHEDGYLVGLDNLILLWKEISVGQ